MTTITDLAMRAKPTAKDQWLTQPFARGAGVFLGRITPAGERLFYFRYTDSVGQRPFLPIGSFHPKGHGGGLSVAQAYGVAAEWSRLHQGGIKDLREHFDAQAAAAAAELEARRVAAEAETQRLAAEAEAATLEAERRLTVRQLFDRWRQTDLQPRVLADGTREGRKDAGAYVLAQFERHVFPSIGGMAATALNRQDLMALLDARKAAGTLRTANVLFSDLRQMLGFAVDREIIPVNPLAGLKRAKVGGKDTERERVLSDAELHQLWTALPAARLNPRSRCALGLILATGARAGEVTGATWADAHKTQARTAALRAVAEAAETKLGIVDMAARKWHLPDTKNQRAHTIHLSGFALACLQELAGLRELDENGDLSPWLFPDRNRLSPVCVKSLGKQIADRQRPADKRMSNRSKNTEALRLAGGAWTLHDLRRTAGTLMARLGISGDVIDECLNHKIESRVRRVYVRDRRESDQERAFDALGAQLARLLSDDASKAGNVVAIHRGA
jgi:integrase